METKWNEKISNNTSDPSRALQRVFVGYLKPHITRKDLFEIFRKYGEIVAISINRNGYGFVEFQTEESAVLATDENGRPNKGGTFQVKQCSPGDVRKKAAARDRSRSPLPSSRSSAQGNYSPRGRNSPNTAHDHRPKSPSNMRSPSSSSSSTLKPKIPDESTRKPNDCEIVVMSKQLRDYAETVERRLKNLGLKVDVLFMKDEALLTQALDDLTLRGTLYACVIAQQHEVHNSLTLNVLYGVPQEHRNMPIDEALKFLAKNFREHLERQRDRDTGDDEREIKFLLKLVIESRYISINEYDRLINHLRLKRDQLIKEEIGDSRPAPVSSRTGSSSYLAGSSSRDAFSTSPEMQNQQLHDQIRKLIGTPAQSLAPAAAPVLANANHVDGFVPSNDLANSQAARPFLNLSNPRVQEALDKLMKNGINQQSMVLADPRTATSTQSMEKCEPFPIHGGGTAGGGFGGAYNVPYTNQYEKYDGSNNLMRNDRNSHYSAGDGRY